MVAISEYFSISALLSIAVFVSANDTSIVCDKLTDTDMKKVKIIVKECEDSQSLGRHPNASHKPLDISTLNNQEFETLFSKKTILNIGLKAWNSKLEKIDFESLESFTDDKLVLLLELADNRQLHTVSFPKIAMGSLSNGHSQMPVFIVGSPLFSDADKEKMRKIVNQTLVFFLQNVEGYCKLTTIIKDMSELDTCKKIDTHLIIDRAVGDTTALIEQIYGRIRITNSNITNLSFLSPASWEPDDAVSDEISNNPNLCMTEDEFSTLEERAVSKLIVKDNKHPLLCVKCDLSPEPSTTCIDGSLSDPVVRSRIETTNCSNVLGDLIIAHVINTDSDLTEKLRAGLSRIRKVVNGSVIIMHNEGIKELDFLPNLQSVLSYSCYVPAVGVWSNFNLNSVVLKDRIILANHKGWRDDCLKLSIGANGEEGRGKGMSDKQFNIYKGWLGEGLSLWIHPRSDTTLEMEQEQDLYAYLSIGGFIAAVSSVGGIGFYVWKMATRKSTQKEKEAKSDGTTEKGTEHEPNAAVRDIK